MGTQPPNVPLQPDEQWCQCPWCGVWLRSYRNDDPLKHHMEYCDKRPEDEDEYAMSGEQSDAEILREYTASLESIDKMTDDDDDNED